MGTKNNPKNRSTKAEKKKFRGKEIEPVYYHGTHAGHGKYMAAKITGTLTMVTDESGKPMTWKVVAGMCDAPAEAN